MGGGFDSYFSDGLKPPTSDFFLPRELFDVLNNEVKGHQNKANNI